MREFLRIKNWAKFQHYQTGKNAQSAPPWIKIYTKMIDDFDFMSMSDARRGQLILIWILASKEGGCVPNDAKYLRKRLQCKVDLKYFLETGWLESYENPRKILESSYSNPRPDLDLDPERDEEEDNTPHPPLQGGAVDEVAAQKAKRAQKEDLTPYNDIANAWNAMAGANGLPSIRSATKARRTAMKARWGEDWFQTHWKEAITLVPKSSFHAGNNESGWKADFDWFIRPGKALRLWEKAQAPAASRPIQSHPGQSEPEGASAYYERVQREQREQQARYEQERLDEYLRANPDAAQEVCQ